VNPNVGNLSPGNNYLLGGESMGFYDRTSTITTLKFEGTSQLNRFHLVKAGLESQLTNMKLQDVTIIYNDFRNQPNVPNVNGVNHNTYGPAPWDQNSEGRNPVEYAAYSTG
jgi:hypothetical protein